MPRHLITTTLLLTLAASASAIDLATSTIVVPKSEAPVVHKAAQLLADDVERVTGTRPQIASRKGRGTNVVIRTQSNGLWEQYSITSTPDEIVITGSDPRGAAYGALHISEAIGVNPWYWFADVPVPHCDKAEYADNFVSREPSVKYRGVFINDEDWGLKTWASRNYEQELGDIGPKTYDRVCELILRLRGNMVAPAMHSCTGAFYSHPESQEVAASYGIMITTSHCEPLLFNNAAESEWSKQRDGEWNYVTNKDVILGKLNDRISQTARYDNIYTMGMRGLHDEAMKGSTDPKDRARTLEQVFADQRGILKRYKVGRGRYARVEDVPQIFVPYKETLDIYNAGLDVPDDITIVWPDDNYGYMKRVSNPTEQQRAGGSGVYYHLSYLGTPHDNLWIPTTAPVLMYEELMKAYEAGASRYWLLNVGDIKPMEIEIQTFMDLAWDVTSYDIHTVNHAQAQWLARIYGAQYEDELQDILDTYYRLAWQRKPEYMGYEIQWDAPDNERLHDSDFSFATGEAQRRLADYDRIASLTHYLELSLPEAYRPSFFEMLGYAVQSASQMNAKFLMAQLNHETGSQLGAQRSRAAYDSIQTLLDRYNHQLDGKWDQMMSEVPPGFVSQYQLMPDLVTEPTTAYQLPAAQRHPSFAHQLPLQAFGTPLLPGMGIDWQVLPLSGDHSATITHQAADGHLRICISMLPMWPQDDVIGNRFALSVDGGERVEFSNDIVEWSAPWKLQVLENRKEYVAEITVDPSLTTHTLTLHTIDRGQFVQGISYE